MQNHNLEFKNLKVGDKVAFSGIVYTARDQAHKKLVEIIKKGEKLPVDLNGQIIYYCGPTPKPPGKVIGSCGPTTASRMDEFTPVLLKAGVAAAIGKGGVSSEVRRAIKKYKAVYFVTIGGAGAYLAQRVKSCELVAYPDLGPEAIYKLTVEDFPLYVAVDSRGRSIYDKK